MPTATLTNTLRKITGPMHTTDRLMIAFWLLLAAVGLMLHARIPAWPVLLAANGAAILAVCVLAHAAHAGRSRVLRWAHDWAAFPLVLFTYKQVYFMIGPIHSGRDYDSLLIAADRWLFGTDPTAALAGMAHPLLTEALQVAYSLFYVFFIVVGVELYRKSNPQLFRDFSFTVVYGFFISYVGYFFLPAVGPRFTLHDFSKIDAELPGLLLTPALRGFVNFFESIPPGVTNAVALASAQRDVFPSGHTMMTLLAIFFAYRCAVRTRHWVLVPGLMLIFATVYLRYHYFVDVAAGALLAVPCLWTTRRAQALFASVESRPDRNPDRG